MVKTLVKANIDNLNVLDISPEKSSFIVLFNLRLEWNDERVTFNYLKKLNFRRKGAPQFKRPPFSPPDRRVFLPPAREASAPSLLMVTVWLTNFETPVCLLSKLLGLFSK